MEKILNLSTIKELAPARAFERGQDYFQRGLVRSLSEYNGCITAKVKGTHTYAVRLNIEVDDDFDYSCTCPMGDEGEFCKHCVAVALSLLKQKDNEGKKSRAKITLHDVQDYLATLDKDTLIKMMMQQVQENESLRQKLIFQASQVISGECNTILWMQMIRSAFEINDYVDYYEMSHYMEGVFDMVDAMEELLENGHTEEVIGLAEYALYQAGIALNSVDDSDGEMGEAIYSLQELHFEACQQAKPDPEELAARLFDMELNSKWDIFCGAAEIYASILGETGLAAYRRLTNEKWAKIEPFESKRNLRETHSHASLNLVRMMETLAEMSGDIEELVEIKKRDLSYAYHYLQIAELYKNAGNKDKALEWAQAGIKAFPTRTDSRLREFLADEYHIRNRHDDALKLIWANFEDHLCLDEYQKLKLHADKAVQWPQWREKSIDLIRKNIAMDKRKVDPWGFSPGYSLLVEIFLWENNTEAAWQEARKGGCSPSLWMQLAAGRKKNNPADAVEVYKKNVDSTINQKNNKAYENAVKLIKKIKTLMTSMNKDAAFAGYLLEIRTKHKPKRNFMMLLDKIK